MLLKQLNRSEGAISAATWQQLLAVAATADEVVCLARDFVASIDHTELARLPADCQPGKLVEPHDIGVYAYDLVRHQCAEADAAAAATVHELAAFFSQASVRLSQIAAPHINGGRSRLFR